MSLSFSSPCKNAGSNTGVGAEELDIDGDPRIDNTTVDIGVDEVLCENIYHPLDWNADGVVNMNEFYDLSAAWLSVAPNDLHESPSFSLTISPSSPERIRRMIS